ncbi:MAG: protein kinase [Gemmatimonadales bacterium]|nr:protein kinase [Gemmatimonadales bacterium]NIN11858.1 protein kinase [Gemmatimonadales bacterium]NIN50408.1 protein kinase [Gemmatimonadales bacterium]NIP07872.1 protein kinase [Gemmatimonadales bacterium]NIR02076.1 protein kinase [Gemmatimonadales bacterium]
MPDQLAQLSTALASSYAFEQELGRGGTATVYRAQDLKHQRKVAVKVMRPELAASLGAERFLREIQIAAQLSHPHILPLYDSGEVDGLLYYVMPFVAGESLRTRLAREGQLPLEDALHITLEVADALSYAHGRGVVHRDIKPENVLLESSHALVTDFGIARAITAAGEDRVTLDGIAVGTPAYMSPEQARGERQLDARTDIYSLGCVLYEMLVGEPPHTGPTPHAILARKCTEPVPSLRVVRGSVSATLERIVLRALATWPKDRYATSAEFAQALTTRLAPSTPLGSTWGGAPTTPPGRSIAVLPFVNMSADPENEYFSDGIAEEIINALTRIKALQVASRTSAFAFKDTDQDIRTIGEELGVATLLEGSVRKAGNRLRITAQLVSVADGYHLWSERYDRDAEDVFAIQDEIAQNIARALRVVLSDEEKQALIKSPTVDLAAYECYLRGRFFLHQFQKNSVHYAREMFTRAIEIDRDFALAFAGVADCSSFLYMYFDGSEANLDRADIASRRALELDSELAEAHAARGLAVSLNKRYAEAQEEFEKAIRLNPALFEPYYFYARTCFQQGKHEAAVHLFEKACDVREDYQARLLAALAYAGLGRDAEAEAAYRRALAVIEKQLEHSPGDARALTLGAGCLARLGRHEESLEWTERALAIDSEDPVVVYAVACVYALVGLSDKALDTMEKAIRGGFGNKRWIANDPDFESLRDHPRFRALLKL